MNFSVNETDFGQTNTVKSFSKTYDIVYKKDTPLKKLVNELYNSGDFILVDRNVYELDKSCFTGFYYTIDAIEDNKNIDTVLSIVDVLYNLQFNKKNKVIVIGGGITQDIGGFVSSIYKRGIHWVFVPTTLLAMTDSCIGGKVGINRNSKNMLGLFSAPDAVYISNYFLGSLKNDDIVSGLGEALKLALIGGETCLQSFKDNYETKNYNEIIKMALTVKKCIVEHDELEKNERRVLNYGHTFGHALESASNYKIPHGIAVLYGMYMINQVFYNDKYYDTNKFILDIIPETLKNINVPYDIFISHVLNDKKNNGNEVCFILLDDIGKTIFTFKKIKDIEEDVKRVFNSLFGSTV